MDNEIMEAVLTEILEEQKAGAREIKKISESLKVLANVVNSNQEKFGQQKAPSTGDIKVIQEIVTDGFLKVQQTVAGQPKTVTKNIRLLLFPETYAEQYYRIVFGRLLFWMMIFFSVTYFFVLGKQGIDSWSSLKEKEIEGNHSLKAWRYLYKQEKKFRSKMDSAWLKSW